MKPIHQFVAGFNNGDAISNEARRLQRLFRAMGADSEIFCEASHIAPPLRREVRPLTEYPVPGPADAVVLLHLSIGSPANQVFPRLAARKAILYHNVTPAEFFAHVQPQTATALRQGREQVRSLAGAAERVAADSAFNAGELVAAGFPSADVLPFIMDTESLAREPDAATLRRFRDGKTNVLFVGRGAPNKRIEDLLMAFFHFQRWVEPDSRFIHVGSFVGTERYLLVLQSMCRELGLRDVEFLGAVPQPRLNACYRAAGLFLSMSEHEGFCVPLMESLYFDVPVVAYASTAVPETLDGAGVCFRHKAYPEVAELMGRVARDPALRAGLLAGQQVRLRRYLARDFEAEVRAFLGPLLT